MADTHTLPIYQIHDTIIDSLRRNNSLILRAPTGSGKSTQVPQFLLDSGIVNDRILVLQPRRLAARMLAARVASERSTEPGEEVGYQTRFESMVSDSTRILFITQGILPRLLLSNRNLSGISTVIFDEFHERSLTTDIGLALTYDMQRTVRPDLRMIIMSATIDTGPIGAYLSNAAVVESSGKSFPVEKHYRSAPRTTPIWIRAAEATHELVTKASGDILIFMPGAYEIRRTISTIRDSVRCEPLDVLPLYGDLSRTSQNDAMETSSRRKVIVATNIAETSLTIPGIRHVIDSGLAKINRYDPVRGFNTLYAEPISIDSADQRAGRAGREASGICIRLWSTTEHKGKMQRIQPEVERVDLAETILSLRVLGYDNPRTFPWFEYPNENALDAGETLLAELNAIESERGPVTDLGQKMVAFPMHPRLARIIIESASNGTPQIGAMAAAILSERLPTLKADLRTTDSATQTTASDFFAITEFIERAAEQQFDKQFCNRLGINISAARQVIRTHALFLQICNRNHLPTRDTGDRAEGLGRALLSAYPDHLAKRRDKGTLVCELRNGRRGELERTSAVRSAEVLVAAEIREIRKDLDKKTKTILSLANEIRQEWLEELFPDRVRTEEILIWNAGSKAIEKQIRTWWLGVLFTERTDTHVDPQKAGTLLAQTIIDKNLPLDKWDTLVKEWINRVRWVGSVFPGKNIPSFSDEEQQLVIHTLCSGETSYKRVKQKPVIPIVQELLSWEQQQFVDTMAPPVIPLPSGRKFRIFYEPGTPPHGRSRIQDLYDLNETPRVANGRIPVRIEILAPNMRPVQITDDLARFWKTHYPEVKKTLSRRYPKHQWR